MSTSQSHSAQPFWAILLHLSFNMWADREMPEWKLEHISAKPYVRFEENLWNDLVEHLVNVGANMVVLDLGDAVRYRSHPEIAVQGAWTPQRLRRELKRLRELGLEPIPKLNFSATHDAWLGPYAWQVSTPRYLAVCGDLIAEVLDLFDGPRFFHLGMDEETAEHQRHYAYVVVRQYDLWWRDLYFYLDQVERGGARAWVWSDYVWHHPEDFYAKMPLNVVQSNWYYGTDFAPTVVAARAYADLEAHGYDQVPTGSNWSAAENFALTVAHCRQVIAPERLLGFLQTVWRPTLEPFRPRLMQAIELLGQARSAFLAASTPQNA